MDILSWLVLDWHWLILTIFLSVVIGAIRGKS